MQQPQKRPGGSDVVYFPMLDIAYMAFSQRGTYDDVEAHLETLGLSMDVGMLALSGGSIVGMEIHAATEVLPDSLLLDARMAF